MKMPLNTLLAAYMKRNFRRHRAFCSKGVFNLGVVPVMAVGLLGFSITLWDINRIIKGGPRLPEHLWRQRANYQSVVCPETERDLKLMISALMLHMYSLIVIGTVTNHVVTFMPWLIIEALVIVMETLVFFTNLFFGGVSANPSVIVVTFFMAYNWSVVFCAFQKGLRLCDFT